MSINIKIVLIYELILFNTLLEVILCVKPSDTPATKSKLACPIAKAKTKKYEYIHPVCSATVIIATSGAEAQGELTSPNISPIITAP